MTRATRSIVIVDNSLTVRMGLAHAFAADDWHVMQVASLAAADDLMHMGNPPSLLLLDSILPDGDATEWLAKLRETEQFRNIPAILFTDEIPAQSRYNARFVSKPYDIDEVLIVAHQAIAPLQNAQRVLVIDDSLTYREELREALEEAGYEVLTAATGEEGLAAAIRSVPHAAIVDNILPGMDGVTVLRRMRQEASLRRMPALLLTASDDPEQELRALEAGADSFVRKDQELEVILARLSAILRSASAPAAVDVQHQLGKPKRILLAAAPREQSSAIAAAIREEGYELSFAGTLVLAREHIRAGGVDCILLDSSIPLADAQTLIREVKDSAATHNMRIILLGNAEGREELIQAVNAGADDYLPLSSGPEVWKARLRAHVRRKQLEDENQAIREHIVLQQVEAKTQRQIAEARAAIADELRRARDLAEEKAAEAERLLAQNEAIFKSMAEGIVLTDLSDNLVYANDVAIRMFHFSSLDEMKRNFRERHKFVEMCKLEGGVLPLEQWPLNRATRGEVVHAFEVLVRHLDTRSYFVGSFNITPVKMRGGSHILSAVTIRDITSQKESEHALRRSEKLAATGRLAASIAHEINNPLAAITNLLFLLQGCNDKSSEASKYLEMAQKELQRVSHITKQTLAFYRETNAPDHVNMNNLMLEVIEILSSPAVAAGIKIEPELSAQNTPRAFAGEVRQVMTNLLANAIDASPSGTTIRVRVRDMADPRELSARGVSILIQDCGKGIPRQLYSQLFQPFVSTKGQKGTGLGLWVTKSIVERHEGFIRYRSNTRPGHSGTCFLVFFQKSSSISDKTDTFATLFREIGRELLA